MLRNLKERFNHKQSIPDFVVGTLGDCLCQTVNIKGDTLPWSEMGILSNEFKKPTIIYLNHENSVSRNIHLSTRMFKDPILSKLKESVNWCWDMSMSENKNKFLGFLDKYFNGGNNSRQGMEMEAVFGQSQFARRMMQGNAVFGFDIGVWNLK